MDYHWLTEVRNYELTLINKYKYKQTGWKEISSLLKNNIYFFSIYLQLHWAFVAAQGLFSGCGKRVTFPCGAEASNCGGFSYLVAQALGAQASAVVAHIPKAWAQ